MFAVQKGTQIVGPILGFDPFCMVFSMIQTAAAAEGSLCQYFQVKKKAPDGSPTFCSIKLRRLLCSLLLLMGYDNSELTKYAGR